MELFGLAIITSLLWLCGLGGIWSMFESQHENSSVLACAILFVYVFITGLALYSVGKFF